MLRKEFNIASLVAGFLAGTLSEEEKEALEQWKNSSEANKRLFTELCTPGNLAKLKQMALHYSPEAGWAQLERKIKPGRNRTWKKYWAYAAMFILPLAVCLLLLDRGQEKVKPLERIEAQQILPGTSRAQLTLADGSVVDLEKTKKFALDEQGGTRIRKDSSVLTYVTDSVVSSKTEVAYNTLRVPLGGEYALQLSDGSRVYLNAKSSLHYPVSFSGDKRVVELEGEAYFEVQKDTRPFIVKTRDMRIKVLGTIFNVSCYPENDFSTATLIEGSVKVKAQISGEKVILRPSEQAGFDRSSHKMSVKEVETCMYTAWRNGIFLFKDWRLEDIMIYLARWYDMNVFYQNPSVKDLRFGCSLNRYGDITPILKFLEKTGKIGVEVKGKTIIFSSK